MKGVGIAVKLDASEIRKGIDLMNREAERAGIWAAIMIHKAEKASWGRAGRLLHAIVCGWRCPVCKAERKSKRALPWFEMP